MLYVVIPAHLPRLKDLSEAMASADGPWVKFVVVTNTPTPITPQDLDFFSLNRTPIVVTSDDEINLAKWYNHGVNEAQQWDKSYDYNLPTGEPKAIFYMESDVRISYRNIYELETEMHAHDVSQIGPNFHRLPHGHSALGTRRTLDYVDPRYRVCQASMVPISSNHRMDEQFAWHMEADDLEWKAKMDRGSRLSSVRATHTGTLFHQMPAELTEKSIKGTELFKKKWGKTPWMS